jgi:hypothetical protein
MQRVVKIAALFAFVALLATACSTGTNSQLQSQRKAAVKQRSQTFQKALDAVPTPKVDTFPLRQTLAEMTKREALLNHPWYVYLLGLNGNAVAYYVAKTVPINACDFLSSTEVVDSSDNGKVVLTAPSLDGIYYGGAGTSSGCDAWVFLDQATNALIQIRGVNFYTADKPLRVDAKPIRVRG